MIIKEPLSGTIYAAVAGETPMVYCRAVSEAPVTINGMPAAASDGAWVLEIPLTVPHLTLTFASGGESRDVELWRVDILHRMFRLSVDDNVRFLQDIAEHDYRSIFENPYLAMYRRLHEKYGLKVHMNIYWESPEYGDFTLLDMPDRYRQEWLDNRDWLRLSFHANADKPNWPYIDAGYAQVHRDCSRVMAQIERFAGRAGYVTTLHFAETTVDGIRALYDCGIRALLGDFAENDGKPCLCYSATQEQFDAVRRHCFWKDPKTGMIFFPCDVVLNCGRLEDISSGLDAFEARYPNRPFMDILIHEQYFYPDYCGYLPDYADRLEAGVQWCLEHGYRPGFVEEILREDQPPILGTLC